MSDAARRPIARTAAVVLEHPRLSAPVARWPLDRAVPQVALVVLMLLAFVALAFAIADREPECHVGATDRDPVRRRVRFDRPKRPGGAHGIG
jgi:hypothetical protein